MKYKGFEIGMANAAGGKAGRGFNKTSTVQVLKLWNGQGDYLLLKQIRFKIGGVEETRLAIRAAIQKAISYVDSGAAEAKVKACDA